MSLFVKELIDKYAVENTIKDIKKQFPNKEIHELMNHYIEPALHNKDMEIERGIFSNFTITSKIDTTTFNVEVDTFIDEITAFSVYIYFPNSDLKNIEYTIEYKVTVDKDEGRITITDNESKVIKNKDYRVIRLEFASKVQTYIDNNLRYELCDIKSANLFDTCLTKQNSKETYIDLDKRAVRREVIYDMQSEEVEEPLTIKYLEANKYYAPPFKNLYELNYSENNNKMEESTESTFNDLIEGGNNRVLYK